MKVQHYSGAVSGILSRRCRAFRGKADKFPVARIVRFAVQRLRAGGVSIIGRVALVMLLLGHSASAQEAKTNDMCPVLQDRVATDEFTVEYRGHTVRFCCEACVTEFERDPQIYENVIPQLEQLSLMTRLRLYLAGYGGALAAGGLTLLLIGLRIFRPAASTVQAGWLSRSINPVIPLSALTAFLGYEVWNLQSHLHDLQLEDEIHYATFYDFGYPPIPRRAESPARTEAEFYRGNDERSDSLFNGGNYRTATFRVSLENGDGQLLRPGDLVECQNLFVRLVIDRPPFTPDFMYSSALMEGMFLTAECDRFLGRDKPVADRVGLTEVEPMQRWEARFPLTDGADCCLDNHSFEADGTIYVCEDYYYQPQLSWLPRKRGGSRFHYGIRYCVQVADGRLQEGADVYMGALYRTRKLPTWRVPMTEWFSSEPIPVLPEANTTDAELLGVDDYLSGRAASREERTYNPAAQASGNELVD